MTREALASAAQILSPNLPGALAWPAGAPWQAIAILGALGLLASSRLAFLRERNRHTETILATLTSTNARKLLSLALQASAESTKRPARL